MRDPERYCSKVSFNDDELKIIVREFAALLNPIVKYDRPQRLEKNGF
jgi:hypothetical protein